MKGIFEFIEKYFFIIILVAVAISLIYPNSFKWVLSKYNGINIINLLLSIVLFTMGTTLKLDDFINVFKNPKEIAVGISAQYIIMPIMALTLASAFSLDSALTVGLILVGTVPGGTASDVISPILTPLITLLLIGNQIHFNPADLFISIVEIVIIPIILGLILNYKFPDFCEKLKKYLPTISSIVICLIVAGVIGANKQAILTSSSIILIVIVLQYIIAMLIGFGIGYLAGMDRKQIITIAIELAFQNSGLSTSLAKTHFPNLFQATVPGVLYSVLQNFAGSILAYAFRKYQS